MKKQLLVAGIICFIAIAAGAGVYYFIGKKQQAISNNIGAKPVNINTERADKSVVKPISSGDVVKQAALSGDLNQCAGIADKILADDCRAQASFSLAIQKKDKKYCADISNQVDKANCLKVLAGMGVK